MVAHLGCREMAVLWLVLGCDAGMVPERAGERLLVERRRLDGLLSWVEGIADSPCGAWVGDNLASSVATNVPNGLFGVVESLV